jgi:hypothetical protein
MESMFSPIIIFIVIVSNLSAGSILCNNECATAYHNLYTYATTEMDNLHASIHCFDL